MPETWLSDDTMFWNNSISKSGYKHMHSISTFIYHLQMCPKKLWIGSTCTPMCTEIHMHMNSYMHLLWFFSDFIMIHFCEIFINYPNLGIAAMPRDSSAHLLFSSLLIKCQAPTWNVALQGHNIQIISQWHVHKWGHAFEMLGTGPDTQLPGMKMNFSSLFPSLRLWRNDRFLEVFLFSQNSSLKILVL